MSEWIPTPFSDTVKGRWPTRSECIQGLLWQMPDGHPLIQPQGCDNTGIMTLAPMAWQLLPEPYKILKKQSEVDRLRDEFAAGFKAGMDFNDIANLFPDYIKKLCRAIIAEGK